MLEHEYALMIERLDAKRGSDTKFFVFADTVAAKIVRAATGLGASRFDMKYSAGTLPHELMMHSIELYATEVVPRVRAELDRLAA